MDMYTSIAGYENLNDLELISGGRKQQTVEEEIEDTYGWTGFLPPELIIILLVEDCVEEPKTRKDVN